MVIYHTENPIAILRDPRQRMGQIWIVRVRE
jgi:hypothetical protein